MKPVKKSATGFLNLGSQIKKPAESCITPNIFQTVGEIESCKEQGGSINIKNLSAATTYP